MKYQSRETIDAIGFQEFVEIALASEGTNIVNGVPWSFHYEGWPVTHENDDLYLVGIAGGEIAKFHRGDFIAIDDKRHLWIMTPEELHKLYVAIGNPDGQAGETPETNALERQLQECGFTQPGAEIDAYKNHARNLERRLGTTTRLCARETIRAHDAETEVQELRQASTLAFYNKA